MSETLAKSANADESLRLKARKIHQDAIVIDAATQLCYGYTDHLRDAGVTGMNATVPMPDEDAGSALERIAVCYEVIRHDPKLCLIEKAGDFAKAKVNGQAGVIIAFQDPYPLQYT